LGQKQGLQCKNAGMNAFDLRQRLVTDYARYTRSFIKIADPAVLAKVEAELEAGAFWPEPLLQLNPTFQPGGTIDDLVTDGTLHPECAKVFRLDKTQSDLTGKQLLLHAHQTDGIRKAKEQKSYVLTSGTGSGKSLSCIVFAWSMCGGAARVGESRQLCCIPRALRRPARTPSSGHS